MPGKPSGPIGDVPILPASATILLWAISIGNSVLEIGSGGSTVFLSRCAIYLTSVEHDKDWLEVVADGVEEAGTSDRVDLLLKKESELASAITGEHRVVFIDCIQPQRAPCIARAAGVAKDNSWIVADDYNFPEVKRAVDALDKSCWDVSILHGRKVHPIKKTEYSTSVAFCRRVR